MDALMSGELDWTEQMKLAEQEEKKDINAELRCMIALNFPALVTILME